MDWIKLGRNVKYARARKGYTQAEVAELNHYTNIGGNNVRGVWKHSYSVGSATILGYGII